MGERQVDHELVIRVQQGDKKAFDLLVLKYQQKIAIIHFCQMRPSLIPQDTWCGLTP